VSSVCQRLDGSLGCILKAYNLGLAPQVTGLGGGGFAVVRSSNGSYTSIDFREAAPSAAYENMFNGRVDDSLSGGLAR
jgi:gamma-glutamyltranspeptidase